jgi:hypothetical protein
VLALLGLCLSFNASVHAQAVIGADNPAATPSTKAEAEAERLLELGRNYESLGRLTEAESAYAKAARSGSPQVQRDALNSLRHVVGKPDSLADKYIYPPLRAGWAMGTTALAAAPALGLIGLLAWLYKKRGRRVGSGRLKLGPFADSPKGEAGACFEQVASMIHAGMRRHYRRRNLIVGHRKLPMLVRSQSAEVTSLAEAVLPGEPGKYLASLIRKFYKPKYSLEGVIQPGPSGESVVFISLHDSEQPLKTWNSDYQAGVAVASQKKLAYEALRYLVRHMNR